MRCHKKTKESGYFEGDSDTDSSGNMGKALKRTKVFTLSCDYARKLCDRDRVEYTAEELETHIRQTEYSKRGTYSSFIIIYVVLVVVYGSYNNNQRNFLFFVLLKIRFLLVSKYKPLFIFHICYRLN